MAGHYSTMDYPNRAGTGMKKQVRVGYQINFKFGSGTGPHKTLPENTSITGEVIHRHKSFEYASTTTFSMATELFSIFMIWRASNHSVLSLRLAGTTVVLYPIEEQIPVLPGRIQVPVPSIHSITILNRSSGAP